MKMSYIWNHDLWPNYVYDVHEIERCCDVYLVQKRATDLVFGLIDPDMGKRMHVRSLTDEMLSSLEIEGEKISYKSVYSSICRRLDIQLETKAKTDRYAEDIAKIVIDATGNLQPLSTTRIKQWHSLLFSSSARLKPNFIGDYRQGPVFITTGSGRNSEVIYEGLPYEYIDHAMEDLIEYINNSWKEMPLVKSAIASLWFLCIHPFEDGNGRISRAIADYVLSVGYQDTSRVYSMSSLILKHREEYYHVLQEVSSQAQSLDLTRWIVWNIDIAIQAKQEALNVYRKSIQLTRFMKSLDPSVYNSRQLSMLYKLADGSFEGKLSTDKWAKMNKCSVAAASRDIQHLLKEGLLVPSGDTGPMTGYYLASDLPE